MCVRGVILKNALHRVIQFGIFLLSHVKEEGEIEMSCVLPLLLIFLRVCVCVRALQCNCGGVVLLQNDDDDRGAVVTRSS